MRDLTPNKQTNKPSHLISTKLALTAGPKDDGGLVSGKLDAGRASLEGLLTDPTDLVVAPVSDVPGPLGDPVELVDADPELCGRRRGRPQMVIVGGRRGSCHIAGGYRCIARSFAGGRWRRR
jgi:hypothetical protein